MFRSNGKLWTTDSNLIIAILFSLHEKWLFWIDRTRKASNWVGKKKEWMKENDANIKYSFFLIRFDSLWVGSWAALKRLKHPIYFCSEFLYIKEYFFLSLFSFCDFCFYSFPSFYVSSFWLIWLYRFNRLKWINFFLFLFFFFSRYFWLFICK